MQTHMHLHMSVKIIATGCKARFRSASKESVELHYKVYSIGSMKTL